MCRPRPFISESLAPFDFQPNWGAVRVPNVTAVAAPAWTEDGKPLRPLGFSGASRGVELPFFQAQAQASAGVREL